MSEIIPIVNKNDEVISSIQKDLFDKTTGAIYRTIVLFLFNKDGKILIQRRGFNKKTYAGKWDLAAVAGHVSYGEDYLDTVVRETKEEIGLDISRDNFHLGEKKFTQTVQGKRRFTQVFWAIEDFSEKDIKLQKNEVAEFKLISLPELKKMYIDDANQFADYGNFNIQDLSSRIKNFIAQNS